VSKNVLVTGAAGYIGAHVCKALKNSGFKPVGLDDFSMGHKSAAVFGPCVQGSLLDQQLLKKVCLDYKPIAAVHLAGKTLVGESMHKPALYIEHNCTGTANLVEALLESGCNKLIFSSSCAIYGNPEKLPLDETHPKKPINPYGASKLLAEKILEYLSEIFDFSYVALRYFNAAGADPEKEVGEKHSPETHLIPLAIEAALGIRGPLSIFGSDFPTPDGTAIRDYIHVCDIASAHIQALNKLLENPLRVSLNLGTGQGYSVQEVIKAVSCLKPVPFQYAPRRAGDPPELVADPTQAKKILGWTPSCSSLQHIVETAYNWHCSELERGASECLEL